MSSLNKGLERIEVDLSWDPSPAGSAGHDLDLVAATYATDAPSGAPAYLVHFDSRAPDGTITLTRDSRDGKGLGVDERLVLELDRLAHRYPRVVVGVAIQQNASRLTFGDIANPVARIRNGRAELAAVDFAGVDGATAARVAEFVRNSSGVWAFRPGAHGFDADPATFARIMGT
ncbi:TerD family protein [Streptomyces sp. NRRL S-495]|uniref:TerD family protein n=1 Tax=Streptomyces sp. NRRL S-495 TaxID=1609133 RepID=UPI0005F920C3|nr:TerD family protein [Streptomyces sp. NRRL S-495]KJY30834.1 TerD-family protein [Streptomyces sp. NRRL S-495]